MAEIGFIGIGRMGAPMAGNLARAGHGLRLYDLDKARAGDFAQAIGARLAESLGELGECDFVVCMLPTSGDVAEALLAAEDGAFLKGAHPGLIVIDMSSSEPGQTRATGAKLAAAGVTLIDAPVSGGVPRAEAATLAIMIGCDDPEAVAKADPVLAAMGDRRFRVGKLGAGCVMKAANNVTAAATYAATAEALTMGKEFGLDPAQMVEIINVSTGRSFVSEVVMKDHVTGAKWATGFLLSLLAKDVGIAARLADELELDAPLAALTDARMQLAVQNCGEGADHSEAILGWYPEQWEK